MSLPKESLFDIISFKPFAHEPSKEVSGKVSEKGEKIKNKTKNVNKNIRILFNE
jgi:hypothetical protein